MAEDRKLTFDEACKAVRENVITPDMTYDERMAVIRRRMGL